MWIFDLYPVVNKQRCSEDGNFILWFAAGLLPCGVIVCMFPGLFDNEFCMSTFPRMQSNRVFAQLFI